MFYTKCQPADVLHCHMCHLTLILSSIFVHGIMSYSFQCFIITYLPCPLPTSHASSALLSSSSRAGVPDCPVHVFYIIFNIDTKSRSRLPLVLYIKLFLGYIFWFICYHIPSIHEWNKLCKNNFHNVRCLILDELRIWSQTCPEWSQIDDCLNPEQTLL